MTKHLVDMAAPIPPSPPEPSSLVIDKKTPFHNTLNQHLNSTKKKKSSQTVTQHKRAKHKTAAGDWETSVGLDGDAAATDNISIEKLTAASVLEAIRHKDTSTLLATRTALLAQKDIGIVVLEAVLNDGNPEAERFAIGVLARMNTAESMTLALAHMLRTPAFGNNHWDRLARVIGNALNGSAVELVAKLSTNTTDEGRSRMLSLLANVRSEEALLSLLIAAGGIDQHQLNDVTMKALFKDGKRESTEIMKDFVLLHEDSEVVALAANSLARRGTAQETQFLAQLGNADGPRSQIARDALSKVTSNYSQNTLIEIANDKSYNRAVRKSAIVALGSSGNSDNVQRALHNLLITNEDPDIRIITRKQLDNAKAQVPSNSKLNNVETWF